MKSSTRLIIRNATGQHEPWSPTELYFQSDPVEQQKKAEKIQELFSFPELTNIPKKDKNHSPNLHLQEDGRNFTSWQPNDAEWQVAPANKDDWSFIETSQNGYYDLEKELVEEVAEEEETVRPDKHTTRIIDLEKQKAEVLNLARAQADAILLEARTAADNLLLLAQVEIEQKEKEGFNQGLEKGLAQGLAQGLDESRQEYQSSIKATQSMVAEVRTWQNSLLAQSEKILIDMVKDISHALFGEGVKLDGNALQMNLNRIMESAQGLGDLNIFLNPRDSRLLDPSWSEYQFLISGDKVKIIPSENITPGGCFIKGNMGTVDGRVETQLAAIMKSFEETKEINE